MQSGRIGELVWSTWERDASDLLHYSDKLLIDRVDLTDLMTSMKDIRWRG